MDFRFINFLVPTVQPSFVSTNEVLRTLSNKKLRPSTNGIPERFEYGTLPYELLSGCSAAVDYIASLAARFAPETVSESMSRREKICASMIVLEEYEHRLLARLEAGLIWEVSVWKY